MLQLIMLEHINVPEHTYHLYYARVPDSAQKSVAIGHADFLSLEILAIPSWFSARESLNSSR